NKNITAKFTYSLTVSMVGSGTVAKNPNQANYAPGSVVQLTANPAVGWHLVSWSGDASGTANPLSVTMDANKNITATFAINTYTLSLTTIGNGTASKSPDQPTYNHGTVVQLTATPNAGQSFVGWTGDASGTANPLSVTMDANKSITAQFTLSLNVSVVGSGTVAKNPNQANYAPGTVVQITATIAIFTHTLSVTTVGSGTLAKNPNQATYTHGTVVQLTATPAAGWHFVSWSGDASGTANPLSVTMDADKSITATFAINTYTLSVTTAGSGTVAKSPNQP